MIIPTGIKVKLDCLFLQRQIRKNVYGQIECPSAKTGLDDMVANGKTAGHGKRRAARIGVERQIPDVCTQGRK